MKSLRFNFIKLNLVLATCLYSCTKENAENGSKNMSLSSEQKVEVPDMQSDARYNTFYGPVVQMGNGHIRSWININHNGQPLAVGAEITDGALTNLPHDVESFSEVSFILPFHQKVKQLTAYDHMEIDWNEHGHEPPGIYDLPHFDFHFYMITVQEQMAIPPYEVAPALFDNLPSQEYLPALYFRGPGGVPQMGVHWVDLLSPEFSGQTFTSTFLYGTYDGRVTFHEPMVTMDVIQSGEKIEKEIRQPELYSPANRYYPTRYSIWKDDRTGKHYLSLDHMILR